MNFMEEAIKTAKKSLKYLDIPVGAVIVCNNKIISRGYNNRIISHKTTAHAEINAINNANKKINDWRLDNCIMYVTLQPCKMCLEVINEARIKKVYYLLEQDQKITNEILIKYDDEKLLENYKNEFCNFFKMNCKR